jgi:aminopeptidase N
MPAALLPFAIGLSSAPPPQGGPGSLAPDRRWDVTHLHLDLELQPERGRIQGSATLSLSPLSPPSSEVRLHQVGLDIESVRVGAQEVPFRLGDQDLHFEVEPVGAPLEVVITYSAEPQMGLHFRRPEGDSSDTYPEVWSQGEGEDNRHWLPIWDYPNDRFSTSGRFVAPEGWSVLSNGEGSQQDDGSWAYRLDEEIVGYLVMLAAAPYQVVPLEGSEPPVQWWIPPDAEPEQVRRAADQLPDILDFFGERTGLPYPYPIYREVYVQRFLYTGMENASSTVMHRRVLLPEELVQTRQHGSRSVVAHELAHQWFGDALTCKTWHELWLNEGFATFFAAEWMRQVEGDEAFYRSVAGRFDASHTGPLAGRFWSTEDGEHPPSQNVYSKGSSVLQMLRVMVGEEAFWQAIQLYTTDNAHSQVETGDLRRAFEQVTGQHLRWFFDQWVHLGGAPTLTVSPSYSADSSELTLRLSQEGPRLFVLPVDLEIGQPEGEPVRRRVWMDQESSVLVLSLDQAPSYVAVDPDAGLLATLDNGQSAEMWRAQAQRSTPYARVRAIRALADEVGADNTDLLAELAASGPQALRREAIAALSGRKGSVEILEPLLLEDPDAEIRRAAASSLGESHLDVGGLLLRAWRAEDQPDVRASLLRQLRRHDHRKALAEARSAVRQRLGTHNPVQAEALKVLGLEGGRPELALAVSFIDGQVPTDVLNEAIAASARIARRLDDPAGEDAEERVARALDPLLTDRHFRTRQRVVSALGQVGDEDSLRGLQALAKLSTIEAERQAAKDAVTAIRSREGQDEPDEAAVDARLKELEEALESLQSELEALNSRM